MTLSIYNSLTRQKEEFVPYDHQQVKIYTCGPTVYDYVTVGNWRTYFLADILLRTLSYLGYKYKAIMNITDVGHLTGDNLGDASIGEDRLEKGAKRENKSAWDIAQHYTDDFLQGYEKLNLTKPDNFTRATDYIQEQINLIKMLEDKGYTYQIEDGVYFDVQTYEKSGFDYDELTTLDQRKEGARVAVVAGRKDPRDFALWKFSPQGEKRQMEWKSPWGMGFPGWHIECSAMVMKELGDQIDIHLGGEDLRSTHHPNEIAQSQAATGKKPFVKYWLHGAFIKIDGGRMGKSLGNAYNLDDLKKRYFNTLALRYFYMTGHYRKPLNFTWEALENCQESWLKLLTNLAVLKASAKTQIELDSPNPKYDLLFRQALADNLNMPLALSCLWQMVDDQSLLPEVRLAIAWRWDKVFGLGLKDRLTADPKIEALHRERQQLRKKGEFQAADEVREKLYQLGRGIVVDIPGGGTASVKIGKVRS